MLELSKLKKKVHSSHLKRNQSFVSVMFCKKCLNVTFNLGLVLETANVSFEKGPMVSLLQGYRNMPIQYLYHSGDFH